ncbi:Uncharacterised protein [Chryseobacterium nakagawai]|uniref:Uncharacterized protein n=1 Tax=Chryseobacterium nakagawai TaxID=1241982 RepID=A0AAD0YLP0_CHRNA|nr:hypothetical protein [Chryseobacterium nakagawai]AZA92122.1 hypothetical protein EG343_16600 [Chryseobacterium nakagawai]VEH18662.1 Uncharacterised protein [Chryseobacterium nakagawai]
MKTKKDQLTRIINTQSQLLNLKIMELQMGSVVSGTQENDSRYVAAKNIRLPDDGSQITVSIYFGGEGQLGSATLKVLRTNQESKFIKESIDNILIGTCNELIGHVLNIESFIQDVSRESNKTILTVKIRNAGKVIYDDTHVSEVKTEGGVSLYTHHITFY